MNWLVAYILVSLLSSEFHSCRNCFELQFPTVLHDVSYGALTQLWAATSAEGATLNGKVRLDLAELLQ